MGSLQDIKSDYVYMLHAEWLTPIEGLRLGISHGQYQYYHDFLLDPLWAPFYPVAAGDVFRMTFDNMRSYVGSAEYTIGNLVLFGEIMILQVDYEAPGWVGETVTYNYYAGASYRVNDWLEVGSYYSEKIDPNDRDGVVASSMFYPTHYVETKDFAFSLRFDINDYWLFKTEYHHIDGSADMSFPYNPNGTHGSSNMLLGKITFSF